MGAQTDTHWLVLRIGGADFLHCWVTDSIQLERAEFLITLMAAYLEHLLISVWCYL